MKSNFGKIADQLSAFGKSISPAYIRMSLLGYGMGAFIIGLILARWVWILFSPHVLTVLPQKSDTAGNLSAALFGMTAVSGVAGSLGDSSISGMRLIGVYTGKQGFAVLRLDEKHQLGVALGEEISKGVKLVEVASDYVILEFNGVRKRLDIVNSAESGTYLVAARQASSTARNSESIVKSWNQAQKEIQNGNASSNARQ